jgi:hypothetical protein
MVPAPLLYYYVPSCYSAQRINDYFIAVDKPKFKD